CTAAYFPRRWRLVHLAPLPAWTGRPGWARHEAVQASGAGRLELLYELGCAFAARLDLEELAPLIITKCREVLDAEGASLLLLDPARGELYFPYVAEERAEVAERLLRLRFPAEQGIAGEVLRTARALRVDDASRDPRFYPAIDRDTGFTTRSLLSAPLTSRQGIIGVIQVVNRHGGTFDDDDLAFLEALAGGVARATRALRGRGRRDDLPRRSERDARIDAGEAPARPPGRRGGAARRHALPPRRCARDLGDESRSRRRDASGRVP